MSQGGRTKIAELLKSTPAGSEVTAKGWVRTKRGNKNVAFIALNDGSIIHNIQIVVDVANFDDQPSPQSLRRQFADLLEQYDELHQQMIQFTKSLIKSRPHVVEGEPLPNYEIKVPKGSPVIGKSLGELKYWQSTGGTIVAIRRGASTILSPGPYAELYDGDVIILVGTPAAAEASIHFVAPKVGH